MDKEDLDESELSSYESQHHHDEQTGGNSSDMSGSKWQLKGKRNIRNAMKRPIELVDGKDSVIFDNRCNGAIHESLCEGKGNIVSTARMMNRLRLLVQQRSEELSYTYDEDDLIENDLGQIQTSGFGNRKYPSNLKASSIDRGISNNNFISSDEDSLVMSPSMWEADRLSQATLKGYWKESDGWFNPTYISNFGDQMGSILVDVDLKVQASYKGEHVPLVSLMSRLNGKAIVGHPVQVEKLEDGSSDLLVCRDDFCEELPNDYEKTALPPVWRTARRTTMHRVPRPPPSPALERGEASFVLYSHPFKKPYAGHIKNKVIKRTLHHIRHPPSQKKFSKKLLSKVSSPSLKTRTLSSIAIEQRCSSKTSDSKQADKNVELYGLIKLEDTVPLMTCVPVKLAFSRILEAIGRPPSISGNRRGFQQIIGS